MADPHLHKRGYLEVFRNSNAPQVGPRVYAGRPFRTLPDAPLPLHLVSALGQHNQQLLRDVAGLSEAEVRSLMEAGIVATQPRDPSPPAPGATAYQAGDLRGDPHYKDAVQALVEATPSAAGNTTGQGR